MDLGDWGGCVARVFWSLWKWETGFDIPWVSLSLKDGWIGWETRKRCSENSRKFGFQVPLSHLGVISFRGLHPSFTTFPNFSGARSRSFFVKHGRKSNQIISFPPTPSQFRRTFSSRFLWVSWFGILFLSQLPENCQGGTGRNSKELPLLSKKIQGEGKKRKQIMHSET